MYNENYRSTDSAKLIQMFRATRPSFKAQKANYDLEHVRASTQQKATRPRQKLSLAAKPQLTKQSFFQVSSSNNNTK